MSTELLSLGTRCKGAVGTHPLTLQCCGALPRAFEEKHNMPLRTIRELIHPRRLRSGLGALAGAIIGAAVAMPAHADETCMSPYMAKIVGHMF